MNPNPIPSRAFSVPQALTACLVLLPLPAAFAASDTWLGATDGIWTTGTNWVGGANPGVSGAASNVSTNTDIATFNNAVNTAVSYGGSDKNLGGVNFTGAGVGAFSITSSGTNRIYFTLGGAVTMDSSVANPQTFARVGLSGSTGSYTFENNAAPTTAILTMGSTFSNNTTGPANLILTGSNTGLNIIMNTISQAAGAGVLSITKNGTGTWLISNNTHTGGVVVNDGILGFASSNAVGTGGILTLNGGGVATAGLSIRTVANNVVVGGNFQLGGVTSFGINLNGTMDLGGAARTITLANPASIGGVISNGGLTLASGSGSRALTLGAANTYAGATVVSSGTLLINGSLANSSSVSVSSAATLGGDGAIANGVTVDSGAFLEPGVTPGVVGSLATGMLTLSGTYRASITGNGVNDLLTINGAADFNGSTIVPLLSGYVPALNDAFNLADWSGSFSGTPAFDFSGAVLAPGLEWDATSFSADGTVRVVAVPEPTVALLGSLGFLALLRRRRA